MWKTSQGRVRSQTREEHNSPRSAPPRVSRPITPTTGTWNHGAPIGKNGGICIGIGLTECVVRGTAKSFHPRGRKKKSFPFVNSRRPPGIELHAVC